MGLVRLAVFVFSVGGEVVDVGDFEYRVLFVGYYGYYSSVVRSRVVGFLRGGWYREFRFGVVGDRWVGGRFVVRFS